MTPFFHDFGNDPAVTIAGWVGPPGYWGYVVQHESLEKNNKSLVTVQSSIFTGGGDSDTQMYTCMNKGFDTLKHILLKMQNSPPKQEFCGILSQISAPK